MRIKIEKWSFLKRQGFILIVCVGFLIVNGWVFLRSPWLEYNQAQKKRNMLFSHHIKELRAMAIKKQNTKEKLTESEQKQLRNLHAHIAIPTLVLFIIRSLEKQSLQLIYIKPMEHASLEIASKGDFFRVVNWLLEIKNSPWLLKIISLNLASDQNKLAIKIQIQVVQ
jgi:hypothetical protein